MERSTATVPLTNAADAYKAGVGGSSYTALLIVGLLHFLFWGISPVWVIGMATACSTCCLCYFYGNNFKTTAVMGRRVYYEVWGSKGNILEKSHCNPQELTNRGKNALYYASAIIFIGFSTISMPIAALWERLH